MTSHLPFLLKSAWSLSMLCPRPCPPLWEVLPKLLMPLISQPSSHPDSVTLSPIGYCWPALVLVCELVQAGIVSVLVNAVSSWCLVIVTCITGGTDRSRVPSAPSALRGYSLDPPLPTALLWLPRARGPSVTILLQLSFCSTMCSAQTTCGPPRHLHCTTALVPLPCLCLKHEWPSFTALFKSPPFLGASQPHLMLAFFSVHVTFPCGWGTPQSMCSFAHSLIIHLASP